MATNLELDKKLIEEALELGQHQTKRAVVEDALNEYVMRRKQMKLPDLFGTIDFVDDYKEQRQEK